MALGQKRNKILITEASRAMDQFKYEVANELGIQTPQSGYWGDLPSRMNGAVGGHMVRRMIAAAEQALIEQAATNVSAGFQQGLQQQGGASFPPASQQQQQARTQQTP